MIVGVASVVWGLYAVLAYQVVVTTAGAANNSNAYANGTFVLIQMIQAVVIGLFGLILAVLGR
jgi:hypothetical protein